MGENSVPIICISLVTHSPSLRPVLEHLALRIECMGGRKHNGTTADRPGMDCRNLNLA